MAIGYLVVETTTADGTQLVPQCNVTITEPDSTFRYTTQTNMDGRTNPIELPTKDKELSMTYQAEEAPFQRYQVYVDRAGYHRDSNFMVDIFDGVVSYLPVHLIPAKSQEIMPVHQKTMATSQPKTMKVATLPRKSMFQDKVKIPLDILVKLGPPDSLAPVIQVSFLDYIKAVTSNLVYPTWPEEAIRTVVYAVVSTTLQRLTTKHYEGMGYPFQITSDSDYDQPFHRFRSIPVVVSRYVDTLFNEFVSSGNVRQPIAFRFLPSVPQINQRFTARVDDRVPMDPWQVMKLAMSGLNALEIFQELYGKTIFLPECSTMMGIPKRYPGRRLRMGSTGSDVTMMQNNLNIIGRQFPTIPEIDNVNGIYDQATEDAVIAAQELFFLDPSGFIDKETWYRISYLVVRLKWRDELLLIQRQMVNDDWSFPGELREGAHQYPVYQLQFMLNIISLFHSFVPSVNMDSHFRKTTRQAVAAFQQHFRLPVTGVVNEETWNLMHEIYERNAAVLPLYEGVVSYPGEIQLHHTGPEVTALQIYLNEIAKGQKGWPKLHITGNYDQETSQMVQQFQQGMKLPPTGNIDLPTWNLIIQEYIKANPEHPFPNIILRPGMSNVYVAMVQHQLNETRKQYPAIPSVVVNGIYGEETSAAIKAFQARFGLPETGVVDQTTWAMLMQVVFQTSASIPYSHICERTLDYIDRKIQHLQEKM